MNPIESHSNPCVLKTKFWVAIYIFFYVSTKNRKIDLLSYQPLHIPDEDTDRYHRWTCGSEIMLSMDSHLCWPANLTSKTTNPWSHMHTRTCSRSMKIPCIVSHWKCPSSNIILPMKLYINGVVKPIIIHPNINSFIVGHRKCRLPAFFNIIKVGQCSHKPWKKSIIIPVQYLIIGCREYNESKSHSPAHGKQTTTLQMERVYWTNSSQLLDSDICKTQFSIPKIHDIR